MNLCSVCNEPGTICVCSSEDNSQRVAHYCEAHAPAIESHTDTGLAADLRRVRQTLQRVIAFAKAHERMPDETESAALGAVGQLAGENDETRFTTKLKFLCAIVDFIEKNNRFPRPDELPVDPF